MTMSDAKPESVPEPAGYSPLHRHHSPAVQIVADAKAQARFVVDDENFVSPMLSSPPGTETWRSCRHPFRIVTGNQPSPCSSIIFWRWPDPTRLPPRALKRTVQKWLWNLPAARRDPDPSPHNRAIVDCPRPFRGVDGDSLAGTGMLNRILD